MSRFRPTIRILIFMGTLALILGVAAFAPLERTLGWRMRLIYVHGAWVWTGKLFFGLGALAGLAALLPRISGKGRVALEASRAAALTGMAFWLTYLPMAMAVMQINWGGVYWQEPRLRIPLAFGVAGVLLQVGLAQINQPRVTGLANMFFGCALWWALGASENVLHPDSPIFSSDATRIQIYFVALLVLCALLGLQSMTWLAQHQRPFSGGAVEGGGRHAAGLAHHPAADQPDDEGDRQLG